MVSILSRKVTYAKYILTPTFARPLNAIVLAIALFLLLMFLWQASGSNKENSNDTPDFFGDRIPLQVDWSRYVVKRNPVELVPFEMTLTKKDKCPACYGEDLCESFENGDLKVDIKGTPETMQQKGVYFGRWNDKDIVVKTLVNDESFKYYDEYLCKNVTGSPSCDVAKAIVDPKSFVIRDSMLDPHSLAVAYKIGHRKPPTIQTMHCASEELVSGLSSVFDKNKDGALQPDERANFFTSFALNPEATIFRGARKMLSGFETAQEAFHGPKYYGACGRVVVHENRGVPLSSLLDAPWEVRIDAAISLMALVGQLEASDLRWYFVYGSFQLQNFVIDENGYVGIVDAKEIGIVDLDKYPPPNPEKDNGHGLCNQECFTKFTQPLEDPSLKDTDRQCDMMTYRAGQMMNSLLCKMLSDFPEHREPGRRFRGLLHDPPKDTEDIFHNLLKECVEETEVSGRIEAVNSLYTMFDYQLDNTEDDLDA